MTNTLSIPSELYYLYIKDIDDKDIEEIAIPDNEIKNIQQQLAKNFFILVGKRSIARRRVLEFSPKKIENTESERLLRISDKTLRNNVRERLAQIKTRTGRIIKTKEEFEKIVEFIKNPQEEISNTYSNKENQTYQLETKNKLKNLKRKLTS